MVRRLFLLMGVSLMAFAGLCAQEWNAEDSLRLQELLQSEGEIKLNAKALKEMGVELPEVVPLPVEYKPWLAYDASLPQVKKDIRTEVLTLRHYGIDPNLLLGLHRKIQDGHAPKGYDLMLLFTREFWQFNRRKQRERTLTLLKSYSASENLIAWPKR